MLSEIAAIDEQPEHDLGAVRRRARAARRRCARTSTPSRSQLARREGPLPARAAARREAPRLALHLEPASSLDVILGARNLGEMLRLSDAENAISQQATTITHETAPAKAQLEAKVHAARPRPAAAARPCRSSRRERTTILRGLAAAPQAARLGPGRGEEARGGRSARGRRGSPPRRGRGSRPSSRRAQGAAGRRPGGGRSEAGAAAEAAAAAQAKAAAGRARPRPRRRPPRRRPTATSRHDDDHRDRDDDAGRRRPTITGRRSDAADHDDDRAGALAGPGRSRPPAAPGRPPARRRRSRSQYLGVPYLWGGSTPARLRLLGPRHLRLRAARRRPAALRRGPVGLRRPGRGRRSSSRATSSSSTRSTTSASTSATTSSSTRRTPAPSSASTR